MSTLAEDFKLDKIGTSGDDWAVRSKNAPIVTYGQVSFKNGRLDFAVKDWTNGDEDTFSFAQTIHAALDEFAKEGNRTCSIWTNNSRTPVMESRSVTLSCGAKKLVVDATEILTGEDKGKSTQIQELLGVQ